MLHRVWPLVIGYPVGKCGRCGIRPITVSVLLKNKTRAELEDYLFIAQENRAKI